MLTLSSGILSLSYNYLHNVSDCAFRFEFNYKHLS